MSTQRITDDLVRLLELLPDGVQRQLASDESREALLVAVASKKCIKPFIFRHHTQSSSLIQTSFILTLPIGAPTWK